VIAYVAEREAEGERSFGRVRELLKNDDVVFALAKLLDENDDLTGIARTEIAAFLQLTDVTRSGVLATAQSFTEVVNSAPARRTLSASTIDLDAVAAGAPVTIYLVIPPDKLASHGALLRLWIGALLKTVMSRSERPDHDTLFIIDECAQLGQLEHLRVAMTLLRGYGLKVWAFFQDLSQLRRLYPYDWQTIINNAAVFQTFGLTNHVMATETADLVGDMDAFALRSLGRDRQVLAPARARAQVCRLPDYLSDPEFVGRFDQNPMFARRDAPGYVPPRPGLLI
jgi:type IV secretion system protein VirD4